MILECRLAGLHFQVIISSTHTPADSRAFEKEGKRSREKGRADKREGRRL